MSSETQKLVAVTGASTGIGASAARELARRGFHVLAGVRRDSDADAIRSTGIEPVILDITRPEQVEALAARVAGDPRALHALVNNAGISVNAPVEALPMAQWRWVFEVNLFGHIAVTQALLPALLRSKGRVINISLTAKDLAGQMTPEQDGRYGGLVQAITAQMAEGTGSGVTADAAARVIANAVTTRRQQVTADDDLITDLRTDHVRTDLGDVSGGR